MKIIKPDNLSLNYRLLRLAGKNRLAVGMMAFFGFPESASPGLRPEAELWPAVTPLLGTTILDEGWAKPAGEWLLYGQAHAPGGQAVTQLEVAVRLPQSLKSLYVFGERQFGFMDQISPPTPFVRCPLSPQLAFGGPGFPENPHGKGASPISSKDGKSFTPLPNVEYPGDLMHSPRHRPQPAGFWAKSLASPSRLARLGPFDRRWMKEDCPDLPATIAADYFHAAPADQRISGYFQGNETFELKHLHPKTAYYRGQLPGLRARCFVQRQDADGEKRFREMKALAETLILFPDLEAGVLIYRALTPVDDIDGDDVLHLMADWESLDSEPLPIAHYEACLQAEIAVPAESTEEDDADAPEAAPTDPAATAAALAAATELTSAQEALLSSPEFLELEHAAAEMEAHTDAMLQEHGLTRADIALPEPEELPEVTLADLEKLSAEMEQKTQAMLQEHGLTLEDILPKPEEPQPDVSMLSIVALTRQMIEQQKKMLSENGLSFEDLIRRVESRPDNQEAVELLRRQQPLMGPEGEKILAEMEADAAKFDAEEEKKKAEAERNQKLARETAILWHRHKQSFHGLDLSGLDLSALDFSGADFSAALLEKTNFYGSCLQGCVFKDALAQETNFSRADLSRADLSGATAPQCNFVGTRLVGLRAINADLTGSDFSTAEFAAVDLSGALLNEARLQGANFQQLQGNGASFEKAELAAANFTDASLKEARFNEARLQQACFSGADCEKAEFYAVQAEAARFDGCNLDETRSGEAADFTEASFVRARIGKATWDGAVLSRAKLNEALLDLSDFSRARFDGACLVRASAKETVFDKSCLDQADLFGINLFRGSLRMASLRGARLQHANCHGVDFYQTDPDLTALPVVTEGSLLDNTLLQLRRGLS